MLDVGFEKDVETIMTTVPEERQTLLFSATVPKWVKKLVKTYLKTPVTVDLIGEEKSGKMADTITGACAWRWWWGLGKGGGRMGYGSTFHPSLSTHPVVCICCASLHRNYPRPIPPAPASHPRTCLSFPLSPPCAALAIQVTEDARRQVLVDVLTVYGNGKAIVFTQTKRMADEVASAVALHMPGEVRALGEGGGRAREGCGWGGGLEKGKEKQRGLPQEAAGRMGRTWWNSVYKCCDLNCPPRCRLVHPLASLPFSNISLTTPSPQRPSPPPPHPARQALHGDMSQRERERVLNSFREGRISVLVATDVAARGLDIPNVDLVVHYELPQDPESFLHRSGACMGLGGHVCVCVWGGVSAGGEGGGVFF